MKNLTVLFFYGLLGCLLFVSCGEEKELEQEINSSAESFEQTTLRSSTSIDEKIFEAEAIPADSLPAVPLQMQPPVLLQHPANVEEVIPEDIY